MMLRLLFFTLLLLSAATRSGAKPGVILITVDGLGWGDLSASGNAQVPTPRIDKLLAGSAVFRDFHVNPLDAPSRAALLTGLYPLRAGVWGCHSGRNRLRPGLLTMSSHLKGAGYSAALFGTWALGDNHPSRALDQGYGLVLTHPGDHPGGVADFYSNDGDDDLWLLNGEALARKGTPVTVCFDAAISFLQKSAAQPFF
ncbi:MAG TPA: sulfatase-like hydrolase/transferase, partial [Verrucomicrobiales bacterium]|nr:sulfatase-like hydrolase/transferase [Verrucomicrobiales bacterium]